MSEDFWKSIDKGIQIWEEHKKIFQDKPKMSDKGKILVTGTSGFIAPHLANRLVDMGYRVYGLERYVTGRTNYQNECKYHKVFGNLCDHMKIRQTVKDIRPDFVFHLAAMSPVAYSYDRYIESNETNYLATINLAEACYRHDENLRQFIFAGTSEEYGNQEKFPIVETAKFYPNSPYAVSKVASNIYLEYMYDAYDFPMTICRPFNTYGRTGTTHFVVERILSQMLNGKDPIKLGDPEPVRDLMFREDHVEGYLSVFNKSVALGQTFNLCTGIGYTIEDLVKLCKTVTGYEGSVVWHTIPKRPLDIHTLIGDNTKAKSILGWSPKYTLKEGLAQTCRELKQWDSTEHIAER